MWWLATSTDRPEKARTRRSAALTKRLLPIRTFVDSRHHTPAALPSYLPLGASLADYTVMAAAGSKFQAFLNHPAGPKTVFFWAPLMKWALVAAGLKDLSRPAEKLSVSQNVALTATGIIWVRYSLVITPVNYSLAAVNFFVGLSGLTQLVRVANYRRSLQNPVKA